MTLAQAAFATLGGEAGATGVTASAAGPVATELSALETATNAGAFPGTGGAVATGNTGTIAEAVGTTLLFGSAEAAARGTAAPPFSARVRATPIGPTESTPLGASRLSKDPAPGLVETAAPALSVLPESLPELVCFCFRLPRRLPPRLSCQCSVESAPAEGTVAPSTAWSLGELPNSEEGEGCAASTSPAAASGNATLVFAGLSSAGVRSVATSLGSRLSKLGQRGSAGVAALTSATASTLRASGDGAEMQLPSAGVCSGSKPPAESSSDALEDSISDNGLAPPPLLPAAFLRVFFFPSATLLPGLVSC